MKNPSEIDDEPEKIAALEGKDTGILSMAELKNFMKSIHEFWFDAHGDWNTEKTSDSKNGHGMPLAAISGHGHLSNILETDFLEIDPENTHTLSTRDTDDDERKLMDEVGVDVNRMKQIDDAGKELKNDQLTPEALKEYQREWALTHLMDKKFEEIHKQTREETAREPQFIMSYDGDGIHATGDKDKEGMDGKGFSATGTPVSRGGSKGGHAIKAFAAIFNKYNVLAHDVSEYNPRLSIQKNMNLSAQDKKALEDKYAREDGSVAATRELTLALIQSIYASERY